MKGSVHRLSARWLHGFSLIEVVVAMGVLSVAVLSSIALLGRSAGMRSDVVIDTHAPMIVDKVVGELELAMDANKAYVETPDDLRMLAAALPLQVPTLRAASGEPLVLLFTSEGVPLGVMDESAWVDGAMNDDGAILVRCDGVADLVNPSLIRAELTLTHPSSAPLNRRRIRMYPAVLSVSDY